MLNPKARFQAKSYEHHKYNIFFMDFLKPPDDFGFVLFGTKRYPNDLKHALFIIFAIWKSAPWENTWKI